MADGFNWGSVEDLFANRNFQALLAGIGTELDPQGAGGMIGRPTMQMIKSKAAQEATAKQQKFFTDLAKYLGGFTPGDQPGLTSMTMDNKGVTMKMTPEGYIGGAMGSEEPTGELGTTGKAGGKGPGLLGFWQALLG